MPDSDEADCDISQRFINKLPPELLLRIFKLVPVDHLLEFTVLTYYQPFSRVGSIPWYPEVQICVSHVCRHWRNLAISTPSLWTRISVNPRSRTQYQLAATMLERSKSLPIDIYVRDHPERVPSGYYRLGARFPADFVSLSFLLSPHIHRCRSLVMSLSKFDHVCAFLSGVCAQSTSTASSLTTLHMRQWPTYQDSRYPIISSYLAYLGGSSRMLTTLCLDGLRVDWSQPWTASVSNLKELDLSSLEAHETFPSRSQLASILRSAPGLEKLALRQTEWVVGTTSETPEHLSNPIQLPRLATFTLSYCPPEYTIGLFPQLYLPALRHLDLTLKDSDCNQLVHELLRPIMHPSQLPAQGRSHSLLNGLETFKMAFRCNTECVKLVYGELQNVRSTVLSMRCMSTWCLDILGEPCTLAGREGVWLPQLETLFVLGCTDSAFLKSIVRLVVNRKKLGAPFRSLYLERTDYLHECEVASQWFKDNMVNFGLFVGSDPEIILA